MTALRSLVSSSTFVKLKMRSQLEDIILCLPHVYYSLFPSVASSHGSAGGLLKFLSPFVMDIPTHGHKNECASKMLGSGRLAEP